MSSSRGRCHHGAEKRAALVQLQKVIEQQEVVEAIEQQEVEEAIEQQEVVEAIEQQEVEIVLLSPSLSEKAWSHAKWRLWRLQCLRS